MDLQERINAVAAQGGGAVEVHPGETFAAPLSIPPRVWLTGPGSGLPWESGVIVVTAEHGTAPGTALHAWSGGCSSLRSVARRP
jgi:hypothetical protein